MGTGSYGSLAPIRSKLDPTVRRRVRPELFAGLSPEQKIGQAVPGKIPNPISGRVASLAELATLPDQGDPAPEPERPLDRHHPPAPLASVAVPLPPELLVLPPGKAVQVSLLLSVVAVAVAVTPVVGLVLGQLGKDDADWRGTFWAGCRVGRRLRGRFREVPGLLHRDCF